MFPRVQVPVVYVNGRREKGLGVLTLLFVQWPELIPVVYLFPKHPH